MRRMMKLALYHAVTGLAVLLLAGSALWAQRPPHCPPECSDPALVAQTATPETLPVWLVLAMKEFSGPLFRLFRKRRKRFSGLNSREQRKLRREKKQLRLRRTQARRDG